MKRPPITPHNWTAIYDSPSSVIPGHAIKAMDVCKTPVAIVLKGQGASKKGIAEQKANARAIATVPDLLFVAERLVECLPEMKDSEFAGLVTIMRQAKAALTAAGYEF